MEPGKALAIAAAGWEAQAARRPAPTSAAGCGQTPRVHRLVEPTDRREAEDRRRANLTVLLATRTMLARAIAMLK